MKRRLDIVEELCAAIEQDRRSIFNIAQAAGVNAMTLHLWLNGKTVSPKVDTLDRVARVLGKRLTFVDGQWTLARLPSSVGNQTRKTGDFVNRRPRMALWRYQRA